MWTYTHAQGHTWSGAEWSGVAPRQCLLNNKQVLELSRGGGGGEEAVVVVVVVSVAAAAVAASRNCVVSLSLAVCLSVWLAGWLAVHIPNVSRMWVI